MKLKAAQLRSSDPTESQLAKVKRRQIYIICDNILDTYNIGSIFRLADAVAASKVYLCGNNIALPPYHRITKAAVGTDKWVPWEHVRTTKVAILKLRKQVPGIKIVAIEQDKKSVDYRTFDYGEPIAFIVGHETTGVSRGVLDLADVIVELPIYGVNVSLNVMVSLAIVLYRAIEK
ncbi:MAG: TrmH family RNA methyltransferase [Candidatus Curtissbacteria bacterium]|nr:TrmH family RNA methyltransferase [Candidatus Curtissbacteria bacterium]